MAQEIINVGTAPNDGLGDPLRTAFTKTNTNFTQLFSTAGITGIANGTSNVQIPLANGNVTISSAGASNVLIVSGTGVYSTGTLNATGLATLSNLSVIGTVISTGTIQGLGDVTAVNVTGTGNLTGAYIIGDGGYLSNITAVSNLAVTLIANGITSISIDGSGGNGIVSVGGVANIAVFRTTGEYITGVLSASGNVTGGNVLTGGLISATGAIRTSATLSATGNVTGGNAIINGLITATGNIAGSNLYTAGEISATGNVSGNYFIGNGSQLTGIASPYGNSNVAAFLAAFGSNTVSTTGTVTAGNITGGNLLTGGLISATGNITGGNITLDTSVGNIFSHDVSATGGIYTGGVVSATGNVRGGNVNTAGLVSATGNVAGGNIVTAGVVSATGNLFGNVLSVNSGNTATAIVNAGGNAVGNIGSSSKYFNQVFAQATTALYADLAEMYSADADYAPGTVVSFGGDKEITRSSLEGDPRVAGVISEKPSYLMNSGLEAEHPAAVALTGRVPTLVIGPVAKGDMMVSAGNGWARASATPAMGTVIGKALKNFDGDSGIIEIVVGRQ